MEQATGARPRTSAPLGYVATRAPAHLAGTLGQQPVGWATLELRLGAAPGTLAGTLRARGLYLRAYWSREEALAWWGGNHALPMPARP